MNSNTIAPEVLRENCLKFFKNDELAVQVWMSKYALRNTVGDYLEVSPQERFRAIASELARIDKKYKPHEFTEDNYYDYLSNRIIMPGGSGLFGIANPYSISSLGNCFVTSLNGEDSYGAILKIDEELVQIAKRRGGDGMDLSSLRPSLAPVSNAAGSSTGAVSFVPRFSNSAREVAQNGRRGALMLSLSVNHPDIGAFIDLKLDKKTATGANLSVRVTDEFMHAVECNGTHILRYPINAHRDNVVGESNIIRRKIQAKDLWDKMMKAAWQSAEPGILFWDKIISESPADCYPGFKTESTNPCQPGWAPLLTPSGLTTMDKVNIGDQIWDGTTWTTIVNKTFSGIKPVYKYQTSKSIFYGTIEHKVIDSRIKIEVGKAQNIDLLKGNVVSNFNINTQDIMDGLVFGAGSVHKASNDLVYLCIGINDQDYFKSEISSLITKPRPGLNSQKTAYEIKTTIIPKEIPKTYYRKVPERFKSSTNKLIGFLRGLYSANGSVCGNRITLKAASKFVVEDVQLMLNSIGISSYITTNKPAKVKFSNGTYICKQSYDLNITRDRALFISTIGFLQKYKCNKVKLDVNKSKPEVISCSIQSSEFISNEKVYDVTVDNLSHTYWSGGCNVSNCGELPLSPYDSCRLLSVNLTHYVVNPFTPDAYLDMPGLRKATEIATYMMDNIIDLELEKIDLIINKIISDKEDYETKRHELNLWKNIRKNALNGRRAGISAIGHGDMLAMLGMPYANDRSNVFCMDLQYFFALNVYATSILLAEQRGAFPAFNSELEKDNPFLKRLFREEDELYYRMKTTGRRNIALLTIPPSGSLSILFGNQTSGIEPAFDIVYKRKRKVVDGEPGATFTDATGDKFIEYPVLHPGFKTWCTLNGYDTEYMSYETLLEIAKKSPYYKSTSATIDPLKKIEMQGLIQKYVDHSISVTHNLPEDVTLGIVSKIYFAAWKAGCKGCTIYREGSRDGILNSGSSESKKNIFEYRDAPKRPRDLPCDIFYPTINGSEYIILVGLYDGKPFEVFALRYTGHQLGSKGILRKQKSKHYNLLAEDKTLIVDNLGTQFGLPEWNAITRLISWGLRHGGDITFAVDQLNESEGFITDVSKVLARTLKKYVKLTNKKIVCPECGSEMRNEGGCATCYSCGFSKCS